MKTAAKGRRMIEEASGHDLSWWLKLAGISASVGALLFGMISGFLKIDSRLEQHGKTLEALAHSVQAISDRATTHAAVDEKIKTACLEMAIANPRWQCPFGPAVAKRPAPKAPAKQG
jgi:hypothetical protein